MLDHADRTIAKLVKSTNIITGTIVLRVDNVKWPVFLENPYVETTWTKFKCGWQKANVKGNVAILNKGRRLVLKLERHYERVTRR